MSEPIGFKGTPGKWEHKTTHPCSKDYWYVVTADGRGPVMEMGGHDLSGEVAQVKYVITDPVVIEANACLMANSKRLLAALQELRDACVESAAFASWTYDAEGRDVGCLRGWNAVDEASAAIAAALGRP